MDSLSTEQMLGSLEDMPVDAEAPSPEALAEKKVVLQKKLKEYGLDPEAEAKRIPPTFRSVLDGLDLNNARTMKLVMGHCASDLHNTATYLPHLDHKILTEKEIDVIVSIREGISSHDKLRGETLLLEGLIKFSDAVNGTDSEIIKAAYKFAYLGKGVTLMIPQLNPEEYWLLWEKFELEYGEHHSLEVLKKMVRVP
jgi:hypothetical protein